MYNSCSVLLQHDTGSFIHIFHGCFWRRGHHATKAAFTNMGKHYSDVIMGAMASQITGVSIVFSTVCSGADQRKHQSSALLVFVRGIHRWPVNSPHKGPVTRKMFPFDDVIMIYHKQATIRYACIPNTGAYIWFIFNIIRLKYSNDSIF